MTNAAMTSENTLATSPWVPTTALPQPLNIPIHQRRVFNVPTEAVRDVISAYYDMTPLHSDQNRGSSGSRHWYAKDCIFASSNIDMTIVRRTKSQAENGAHLVFVHRYTSGSIRGEINGFSIDRDPGHLYVFDMEQMVECIQFPVCVQGIYIPKWLLGYESSRHAPLLRFSQQTPTGMAMLRDFAHIFETLNSNDALDLLTLERLFASLKVAIVSEHQDGEVRRLARQAMLKTIQAHVEKVLDDPDLSVDQILRTFAVSRASLYRMFDPYGGVRHYISNRRLCRAVLELSGKQLRRGDISAVSDKWGFSSHSSFHRAVKNRFGATPGSLVGVNEIEGTNLGIRQSVYDFARQTLAARMHSSEAHT